MKLTKFTNLILLGAALTIAVNGCKTKPQGVTYLPDGSKAPVTPPPFTDTVKNTGPTNPGPGRGNINNLPPVDSTSKLPGTDNINSKPLDTTTTPIATPVVTNPPPVDLTGLGTAPNPLGPHLDWIPNRDILIADTVYFDFDKSSVKASEQAKLNAVAEYLRSNPTVAVLVEGNCDERGTEEYNRSLGERRALASREYLIKLGIEAPRVDTVTYGEDRPADPGHNEAAWAKNRRDDFIILTAPKP